MIDTFHHQFIPSAVASPSPCLLLLHGTGGNENDLLNLGQTLDSTAALLSPRGKVNENGLNRFFRRISPGVFDVDDVKARANELADWIDEAARTYEIDRGRITAVGYSNGANIASAMMMLRPEVLSSAILFRPMVPLVPDHLPDLSLVRVLLSAGKQDTIATPDGVERLARMLRRSEADVRVQWSPGGHPLTQADIQSAHDWLIHPPVRAPAYRR